MNWSLTIMIIHPKCYIYLYMVYLFLTRKVEQLRIKYLFFFTKKYKSLINWYKTRVILTMMLKDNKTKLTYSKCKYLKHYIF